MIRFDCPRPNIVFEYMYNADEGDTLTTNTLQPFPLLVRRSGCKGRSRAPVDENYPFRFGSHATSHKLVCTTSPARTTDCHFRRIVFELGPALSLDFDLGNLSLRLLFRFSHFTRPPRHTMNSASSSAPGAVDKRKVAYYHDRALKPLLEQHASCFC